MMTLDQFRNRAMTVRVLDCCPECKQLSEDVTAREEWWPRVKVTTCEPCFKKLVAEAQGLIAC
ncbi:hypothetical protein [Paraburkholderia sp. HD33-4]|uniref:hypothetical protein n=1 Tax=Paraburkholderia sp. HD33-4 TaxID=2883242 RepID=UPI001F2CD67A|nr:hypothetical protein [Paraburkholderia sp. HD33-4]